MLSLARRLAVRLGRSMRPAVPHAFHRAVYAWGKLGYLPNYRNPRTFNEKVVAWIRSERDPKLTLRSDKLAVRSFVAEKAPWVALPEVYAVAERAEDFEFDRLPEVSVLKANHGWKQVHVLRRPFDVDAARRLGADWLAQRHGDPRWEWQFLDIVPRLYAEAYLGDAEGRPPTDYKVFVLDGEARFVQCFIGRGERLRRLMFDRSWTWMDVHRAKYPGGPPDVVPADLWPPRPACLDDLLRAAEALGADVPFVRADFYVVDGRAYFGELTYLPAEGYVPLWPPSFDRELGDRFLWPVRHGSAASKARC